MVTEVDRDIRPDAEPGMICQLSATIPSQRCHGTFAKLANLPDECVYHGVAIFTFRLNQHDKAGSPFHQRGDIAIFGAAKLISLPMPRYSAILNLGRSVPDRHRIDNLASGLPRGAGCLAPSHDPAAAQMGRQLFLQHSAG
jgi:hypothetical protein